MANRTYAGEWLLFARKNLEAAEILLNVDHYSDIIGAELQQGVEKTPKAVLVYHNRSIPKTHDLNFWFRYWRKSWSLTKRTWTAWIVLRCITNSNVIPIQSFPTVETGN